MATRGRGKSKDSPATTTTSNNNNAIVHCKNKKEILITAKYLLLVCLVPMETLESGLTKEILLEAAATARQPTWQDGSNCKFHFKAVDPATDQVIMDSKVKTSLLNSTPLFSTHRNPSRCLFYCRVWQELSRFR